MAEEKITIDVEINAPNGLENGNGNGNGGEGASAENNEAKIEQEVALQEGLFEVRQEYRVMESDAMAADLEGKMASVSTYNENVIKGEEERAEREKKINEDTSKFRKKMWSTGLNEAGNFFANMSEFTSAFGKENKAVAVGQKAVAIAQTSIDTYKGAQMAFNALAGIPYVGPVLGAAAAGAAIAAGIARVAKISGISFQYGGIVPGTTFTGDRVPALLNSGEMVLNQSQQSRLFSIADGRSVPGNSNIQLGGDTIIINGNADESTVSAIQQTREQQLVDLREMLIELNYAGQGV